MTLEEIQAELDQMPAALSAAGWVRPEAHLTLHANSRPHVHLCGHDSGYKFFHNDTARGAISAAWDYIRALPDPQTLILATYSRKLADAIDYGHDNNIPAQLVDPVRRAQKATSDMMLPAPEAAQ